MFKLRLQDFLDSPAGLFQVHRLPLWLTLLFTSVFTVLSVAAPKKAADFTGRGLSAPLWSLDDRFIAYTTADQDELYVVELNEIKAKQSLYRVANLEGVGRRFVFSPGEERIVYRSIAAAIKGRPDRLVSCSFYQQDNTMLTGNSSPILGPYLIENKVMYRENLTAPLKTLDNQPWDKGVYLDNGELTVTNTDGKTVFKSGSGEEVRGFEISPDGETVAAVLQTGTKKTVRLIQISSGNVIDLGEGRWPSWSADGNRVVILRDKPDIEYAELIVHDLTVGQSRSVMGINQFWPDEPALNRDGTRVAFVHNGEIYITEVTGF